MIGLAQGPYAVPTAMAYALLHSLWQGALLAAVALGLLRGRSAASRHALGLAILLAMVVAPVATFALYRRAPSPTIHAALASVLAPPSGKVPLVLRPSDWLAVGVALAWLLGAGALLLRQLGGWRVVVALDRRSAGALPSAWLGQVEIVRSALGISRAVSVRPGLAHGSPFTARAWRPVIWLPAPLWARLPPEQRDALLAHELAHVRRLDWLWNGLQSTAEALLFFHPAAWWLGHRVRQEREHACDDLAVAACGDAVALAEGLAALEQQRRSGPELVLAADGGALLQRITRLLTGAATPVRLRVPLGLMLLLGSGTALATQLELPTDVLIDLRVESSTAGPLTPGTFRDITAAGFNGERHYRGSMDARGRVVEIYEENGTPVPIDPGVRRWLGELPTR